MYKILNHNETSVIHFRTLLIIQYYSPPLGTISQDLHRLMTDVTSAIQPAEENTTVGERSSS